MYYKHYLVFRRSANSPFSLMHHSIRKFLICTGLTVVVRTPREPQSCLRGRSNPLEGTSKALKLARTGGSAEGIAESTGRRTACAVCGHRHGEYGHSAVCQPRVSHPDQRCAEHFMGNQVAWAPPGMIRGKATGLDNSCLVHTLMQLVSPSAPGTPGGVWEDEERRSVEIRHALEVAEPSLRRGYLTLARH